MCVEERESFLIFIPFNSTLCDLDVQTNRLIPVITCGSIVFALEKSFNFFPNFITKNVHSYRLYFKMLFLLLSSSVLFVVIHAQDSQSPSTENNYAVRCTQRTTAKDQVVDYPKRNDTELQSFSKRRKRFVLFPEFELWLGKWEYLNPAIDIYFWIANFYPKVIDNSIIEQYIREIFRQVDEVIDKDLHVYPAASPGEANFMFHFFDYSKCPTDDPTATVEDIQILRPLDVYPAELVRKSRYRAHGGMAIYENNRSVSEIKCNMQQTYILTDDMIYDTVIYTCEDEKNQCIVDLFWVLLHETLHGYGIEVGRILPYGFE